MTIVGPAVYLILPLFKLFRYSISTLSALILVDVITVLVIGSVLGKALGGSSPP